MKTMSRAYMILAILLGIVGLMQCIRWSGSVFVVAPAAYLLHFLPSAACLAAYALSRRTRRKTVNILIISLCLAAFAIWGTMTLAGEFIVAATTEVTNPTKCEQVLDEYWSFNPDLVSHFPRPVPPDAKDVRFSFLPGFLQGGAHVQLRYATSPDAIAELQRTCSARKTRSFKGGRWTDNANAAGGMPTTSFHTSGSKDLSFPDDYEIMVFDALPKEGELQSWNHGQSHGVAISTQRNEIVYWAESW